MREIFRNLFLVFELNNFNRAAVTVAIKKTIAAVFPYDYSILLYEYGTGEHWRTLTRTLALKSTWYDDHAGWTPVTRRTKTYNYRMGLVNRRSSSQHVNHSRKTESWYLSRVKWLNVHYAPFEIACHHNVY